jgi:hypothetical protein
MTLALGIYPARRIAGAAPTHAHHLSLPYKALGAWIIFADAWRLIITQETPKQVFQNPHGDNYSVAGEKETIWKKLVT